MGKRGTSIVELIAVIVIMGIIAGIAVPVTIVLVNRQRKNATIASLNNVYEMAKDLLFQVQTGSYDENIYLVDENFCYLSLTTIVENHLIDGENYAPQGAEIYFCYDFNEPYVIITDGGVTAGKPTTTGSALVHDVNVTFSYDTNKFVSA